MNLPYASIRERLLGANFSWLDCDLELQAWTDGNYDEAHIFVSHLVAAGGVRSAKSSLPMTNWIMPGGYAASDAAILPGEEFTVGEIISFFTLSDRKGAEMDPRLILFITDAEELPFVADGLDVAVMPDWLNHRGWWRP